MGGCLQIMQHRIDLTAVRAPTVAAEHARRLAQRGLPLTALLRAYRLAHSCLAGRLLAELAEPAAPAAPAARPAGVDDDIHFTFGEAAAGTAGFRLTHQQAVAAQAAGLGFSRGQALTYRQVAPVAMMLQSPGLLRAWVRATLAGLTADSDHHDRLRETLLVFLQSGGSYKTTAERLTLHKNTVQYRIRKAEESLARPVGQDRHDLELALRVSHWLGPAVLQPG
jgi:hypothetical protein